MSMYPASIQGSSSKWFARVDRNGGEYSLDGFELHDEADYETCLNKFLVQPFSTLPTLTPLCLSKANPVRCGQLKELLPHDLYFSFRCQVLAIRVSSG